MQARRSSFSRKNILVILAFLAGLLPLLNGLGVFFTWWGARLWYAKDLSQLPVYGFRSIYVSFIVALMGIVLAVMYAVKSYPRHLARAFACIALILLNIPAVLLTLDKQSEISARAYVMIKYKGTKVPVQFRLFNKHFFVRGELHDSSGSEVVSFRPVYLNTDGSRTPKVEKVYLELQSGGTAKTFPVPDLYASDCVQLILDDEQAPELKKN